LRNTPHLGINLKESYCHNINQILEESLEHEKASLKLYYDLLDIVLSKSVLLEEYARKLIVEEEMHIGEVEKMLRVNDIDDRCQKWLLTYVGSSSIWRNNSLCMFCFWLLHWQKVKRDIKVISIHRD
jgi:hypothetical protein